MMLEIVLPTDRTQTKLEALEDDVLPAEMRAVASILQAIPGDRSLWIGNARVRNVVQPLVDPDFEEVQQHAHRHIVVIHDWFRLVAERKDRTEALTDGLDLRGI